MPSGSTNTRNPVRSPGFLADIDSNSRNSILVTRTQLNAARGLICVRWCLYKEHREDIGSASRNLRPTSEQSRDIRTLCSRKRQFDFHTRRHRQWRLDEHAFSTDVDDRTALRFAVTHRYPCSNASRFPARMVAPLGQCHIRIP